LADLQRTVYPHSGHPSAETETLTIFLETYVGTSRDRRDGDRNPATATCVTVVVKATATTKTSDNSDMQLMHVPYYLCDQSR